MAKKEEELLSAPKVAKAIGVSAAKVKKAIDELGLAPDNVRCGCKYYGPKSVKKIQKAVE